MSIQQLTSASSSSVSSVIKIDENENENNNNNNNNDLDEYDRAVELEHHQPQQAITFYQQVLAKEDPTNKYVKLKEQSIYKLGELFAKQHRGNDLRDLIISIRPFFNSLPKARTAKIVRSLIDLVGDIPNSTELQAELCKECIDWCKKEKRTFLKQRIQSRLADLYLKMKLYKDAIKLITRLSREVKKIDDKILLLEIELIESRVHFALQNIPKAKGALTAARSAANSIYCPPLLQAEIDLQAGILCAEEKDYKTSFSYFYESFEGYSTANRPQLAVSSLKYMLMSKIMTNTTSDVYAIINGKAGIKYAGIDVEAMKAIADAHKNRSIHQFEQVQKKYKPQLLDDVIIFRHLNELYENLLEQNLIRLIEPFSRVQITHVAKLINLPLRQIETKLSEMILDKKIFGTLDQGSGDLIVFDDIPSDKTFEGAIDTIKELGNVVDKLYSKAKRLQ